MLRLRYSSCCTMVLSVVLYGAAFVDEVAFREISPIALPVMEFQVQGLERFLPKNQHTPRKLLNSDFCKLVHFSNFSNFLRVC